MDHAYRRLRLTDRQTDADRDSYVSYSDELASAVTGHLPPPAKLTIADIASLNRVSVWG